MLFSDVENWNSLDMLKHEAFRRLLFLGILTYFSSMGENLLSFVNLRVVSGKSDFNDNQCEFTYLNDVTGPDPTLRVTNPKPK